MNRALLLLLLATPAGAETLSWTAPHEDGAVGGAVTAYELRYAADSTQVAAGTLIQTGTPHAPGTTETVTFTPAFSGWAAVWSIDDAGNRSPRSNLVRIAAPDTIPPAAIMDLRLNSQEP